MPADLPDSLARLSPWRSAAALALDWALILACLAAAIAWPRPLVWLGAAVLVGRTQLALAVMMHEGAHGLLAARRGLNDFIGQWAAAGPLMLSLPGYRRGHLRHHRAPMAADDPVARVFRIADYPVPPRELAWRLARDLAGIGYLLTLRDLWRDRQGQASGPARTPAGDVPRRRREAAGVAASILVSNGLLLAGLAALGHPGLYLGLWIAPALTWLQLFARIRAITEHAGHRPDEDQTRNARSLVRPNWQTFFCGPHAIHYHIEHHHWVRVPFYRLREAHALMAARGLLPERNLYRGYGRVLREVTRR